MPADINPRRQWSRNPGGFRRQKKAPPEQGQLKATLGDYVALRLKIPIAKVYPLADVREAYQDLARRHTRGKIVLVP
jgi:NADPH:quinone reductase-like Zn-dependent oxidoreductase